MPHGILDTRLLAFCPSNQVGTPAWHMHDGGARHGRRTGLQCHHSIDDGEYD